LPTEAAYAARFGVNRHTVRQALAAMADAGIVHARRGAGVFVTAKPADYPLGRRVRFHQAISASGRTPSRSVTRMETRVASLPERQALGLDEDAMVHVFEGVSLSDAQPIATFRSVFPAARLPGLLEVLADEPSVTKALAACGVSDYIRVQTRLTARVADAVLALALQIKPGAPVLQSVAVNVDTAGVPVEFGTTWFAGDKVALTVAPETAGPVQP
jgi:GntR family phosphonate transport system transcriptional regulator